jgi:hypothetical protein
MTAGVETRWRTSSRTEKQYDWDASLVGGVGDDILAGLIRAINSRGRKLEKRWR